jgi:hypothetical protein
LPNATLSEIKDALAAQLQDTLCGTADPLIEGLQVTAGMNLNPTPPSIDIYAAETFTERVGFDSWQLNFVVRARVSSAEHEGGQDLLDTMMDPRSENSVRAALEGNDDLGGTVDSLFVGEVSGLSVFPSSGPEGSLMGCAWPVQVLP